MQTFEFELPTGEIYEFDAPNEQAALNAFNQQFPQGNLERSQSFISGVASAGLEGATLGLDDEIKSFIAAAWASPFVSDKTFGQLMVDARNSLREDKTKFAEKNPKTALAANIAGGIATGGVGATRAGVTAAAKEGGKELVKATAKFGAVTGAAAGAGFADADEFISVETALGAALGAGGGAALGAAGASTSAALPGIKRSVTEAFRNLTRKPVMQVFDDTGQFTDDAMQEIDRLLKNGSVTEDEINSVARNAMVADGVMTPEQAARFNLIKSRGIEPTRANITQSADDFAAQQSALKRSGPVAERVAGQDARLQELAEEGADAISTRATSLPETNANVFRAVDDVVTQADDAVTTAYQSAREVAQGQPRVQANNLLKAVSDNRGGENVSGGVISSLRGVLKNKGLLRAGKDIDINKRGERATGLIGRKMTVKEAEEIRQHLNSLHDSVSPQGRRLIRTLKDAIDDDVAEAVGEDIFAEARQAKSAFHQMIERGRRNKFDKTRGGFLEDVIDNKIPEEQIVPKLLRGRDDDFQKFKQFLTEDAGEAGAQAWDDIRAQVLRNALDKATSTVQKGEGGQGVFNVRLFRNELDKLKKSQKWDELFNKEERKLISDIIEIGNLRLPVSSVSQGKGPTELAVSEARKAVLRKLPVVGERAQELLDAVANLRTDKRLLDVTRETEAALIP